MKLLRAVGVWLGFVTAAPAAAVQPPQGICPGCGHSAPLDDQGRVTTHTDRVATRLGLGPMDCHAVGLWPRPGGDEPWRS